MVTEVAMAAKLATAVLQEVALVAMAVAMVASLATATEVMALPNVRAVVFKTLATSRGEEATEDLSRVMATARHKTLLVFKVSVVNQEEVVAITVVKVVMVAMEAMVAVSAMAAMVVLEASVTPMISVTLVISATLVVFVTCVVPLVSVTPETLGIPETFSMSVALEALKELVDSVTLMI